MKKISEQKFYTRYNPPPQVSVKFSKPSLTQQQFRQECDINNIIDSVNNAGVTNNPLWNGTRRPLYGDFTGIQDMDYLQAQNTFLEASARFMELPAKVRQRFNNNPAELLAYIQSIQSNPNIKELAKELAKLGFADIPAKVESPAGAPPDVAPEGQKSE